MASGKDESREHDQSEPENQQPAPLDDFEEFGDLDEFVVPGNEPGEPVESLEPTAPFVPVEPTESLEPLEPVAPLEPLAETTVGESALTESMEPLGQTPSDSGSEGPADEESLSPGLAETAVFSASESPLSDTAEGEPPAESAAEAGLSGATFGEGEPTAEPLEPLPEEGLLAGGPSAEAVAAEGKEAEEEEAKAEEEEEEEKGGILAWIGGTSVYNVLLFLAAVALVIGSLGLYLELKRYNFDIKARDGKQPMVAAPAHGEALLAQKN